jgi:hypothetical protein
MAYTVNGPRAGRSTGRQRNTLVNTASKTPLPVVSPQSAVGYGAQAGQTQNQLFMRLAQYRRGLGQVQAKFRMDRAAAAAAARQGAVSVENQALDRGILGSSIQAGQMVGVRADKAQAIQMAVQARNEGRFGLESERIAAYNDYWNSFFQQQAQKRAEQATMANEAFLRDLVLRQGDESGGAGGVGSAAASAAANAKSLSWAMSMFGPVQTKIGAGVAYRGAQVNPRTYS